MNESTFRWWMTISWSLKDKKTNREMLIDHREIISIFIYQSINHRYPHFLELILVVSLVFRCNFHFFVFPSTLLNVFVEVQRWLWRFVWQYSVIFILLMIDAVFQFDFVLCYCCELTVKQNRRYWKLLMDCRHEMRSPNVIVDALFAAEDTLSPRYILFLIRLISIVTRIQLLKCQNEKLIFKSHQTNTVRSRHRRRQ